jgi:hypothetical protein
MQAARTPRLPARGWASLSTTLARLAQALARGTPTPPSRIASCSRVFALELDQTFPDAGGVFNGVSQRCLKLSSEVEAFIRGDEVGGAQVEVVVEPVPQIEQDRLEVGDQLSVRYLRDSLLVHVAAAASTLTRAGGGSRFNPDRSARRPASRLPKRQSRPMNRVSCCWGIKNDRAGFCGEGLAVVTSNRVRLRRRG